MVSVLFLPVTLPSALVRVKKNKKLKTTIVKDLITVMTAEKEVICAIFYL